MDPPCHYFRKSDWVIFMTGRNSLHYCYDVSYQCWFASEEAKIYCNNFNSSNAVVCSHLILAYTVRLAIMNAVELERNGWGFFYLYWGNVVLWLKRTSTKKLSNRISYQIWYKGCLKGTFGRGVRICEGGSISVSEFGPGVQIRGGPNPLWHRQHSIKRDEDLHAVIEWKKKT